MQHFLVWSLDALSGLYSAVTLPFYYLASVGSGSNALLSQKVTMVRQPGGGKGSRDDTVWMSSDVAGGLRELAGVPDPSVRCLGDLLDLAVRRYPTRPCLGTRQLLAEEDFVQPGGRVFKKQTLGAYKWETFQAVRRRVDRVGRGLRAVGLHRGDRVALYAETRAEWQICAQACFRYGLPAVTLYASLGEDALVYGVEQSEAKVLVTSRVLVDKVAGLLARMPRVTCVVYMDGGVGDETQPPPSRPHGSSVRLIALSELSEQLGAAPSSADDDAEASAVTPADMGDLAVIMYTSGSTGVPKGVMITHANLLAMVAGVSRRIPDMGRRPDDAYIGYLPLAHVLELAAELACLASGVAIGYGSPLTLTDASNKVKPGTQGDATALKPTLMAAVPAVLDRASRAVRDRADAKGVIGRALLAWALGYKQRWSRRGWSTPLLDRLVFAKIRAILGGRLRLLLSGGAPLSAETHQFALSAFGADIVQGYGLTETSGAGCIQAASGGAMGGAPQLGSAGPPLACCLIRLRDWPEGGYTAADKPWPRGEVLIGGPSVTAGYYRMPELTAQDFLTDGDGVRWFCTGDIGQVTASTGLEIVDRKKDLVKLQGGEYVSLGKVELVLGASPYVEQICAYGDSRRDFTVLLLIPKRPQLAQLAGKLGLLASSDSVAAASCNGDSYSGTGSHVSDSLLGNRKLADAVLGELVKQARGRLERFELPARLHLCREAAWLPESGLVTDSFKLRRRQLLDHYRAEIDAMYAATSAAAAAAAAE